MNPSCWVTGSCAFTEDPLGTMLMPFDSIFGGLSLVVFWSLIIGVIWLRTQNPMLVGALGMAMSAAYLTNLGTTAPEAEWEMAHMVGVSLFLISLGISFYQVIVTRLFAPPQ